MMKMKAICIIVCFLFIGITFLPVAADMIQNTSRNFYNKSNQGLSGIYFYQVDYKMQYSNFINSDTGLIVVDINELKEATGLRSGYVNVYTLEGWVVNNLAVIEDSTTNVYPYPTICTYFDLGQFGDVTSIGAYIEYTAEPYVSFVYSAALPPYPVGDTVVIAEGGEAAMVRRTQPPKTDTLPGPGGNFNPLGQNTHCVQKEHPNIECANNQCVPCAYANNLQYLEDWYGTYIQHDHIPGLGLDNSLVGTLEHYMERAFISREDGGYTGYTKSIEGLVEYTYKSSITGIEIRHQGWEGDKDIQYDNEPGYISYGQGKVVKFDFIYQEICAGSGVELAYRTDTGGGHMVQIVAAGYILDVPYIIYLDDRIQISTSNPYGDSMGTQPPQPQHRYLIDVDNDGLYNLLADPEDSSGPVEVVCIYVQQSVNSPPNKPAKPAGGELIMKKNTEYEFYTSTIEPDNDKVWYFFDWGDGFTSGWVGPYNSGENGYATHKWLADGNYEIKVKAKDSFGSESEWSEPRIGVVPKSYFFYRIPIIYQILKHLLRLFP